MVQIMMQAGAWVVYVVVFVLDGVVDEQVKLCIWGYLTLLLMSFMNE